MINRTLSTALLDAAQHYPVVTLTGPRQSGKTSLVRSAFPDKPYYNLEQPDLRERITQDPLMFLKNLPEGAILDEIQNTPDLVSYLQVIVDEQQKEGMFILTGSHQLSLHQSITQSLAGRTAMLNLLPLSIEELKGKSIDLAFDEQIYTGFYPRIYDKNINPTTAYRDYFQTYIERDVRQLIQLKDLRTFQNFLRIFAGRIGQLLNASSLGNEIGVSHNTIKHWLSILEASFIVYRLEPYFANVNKRIIKSPKYYFVDTGLACYLLGIENTEQLIRDPLRGQLVENMIVLECAKARINKGREPHLYFYRDQLGHEVDLIHQQGSTLTPIEIKASQTYHQQFTKGLDYLRNLLPQQVQEGYVVYAGEAEQKIQQNYLLNFKNAAKIVKTTT